MKWLLKENRAIKLSILLLLFTIFLFEKLKQSNKQIDGFAHQPSYFIDDEIIFSTIGQSKKTSPVNISSLTNDFKKTIEISSFSTPQDGEVLLNGVTNYTSNNISSRELETGIYLINDTIPFVVKDYHNQAEIVVVYPYVNNLIKTYWKGKSVGTETNTFTHLYRSNFVDPISSEMKLFFTEISENYSVKYISDLDLRDVESIEGAKLVIFYNDILYATSSMKKNFLKYVESGGNVLMASTYFFNNVFWMDSINPNVVVLNKEAKERGITSKKRFGVSLFEIDNKYIDEYIGFSYAKGGFPLENSGYEVIWKDSPLFKGLSMEKVPVHGYDFMGLDGERKNNAFQFNLPKNFSVITHAYLATEYYNNSGMTGVFELQISDKSGKIISLGTNQWFSDWNYGKSEDIRNITRNAIDYLMVD